MKKLLYIEFKKFSLSKHFKNVMIANFFIVLLVFMTAFFNNLGGLAGMPQIRTITVIDTFIKAVFLVWQSILIANLIVEEFRSKTIMILFTYPLNRKKLIISKLLIVCFITLVSIALSQIIVNLVIYQLSTMLPDIHYTINLLDVGLIALTTITSIMLGMLPLYIGMLNKSTVATVASSILIVSLTVSSSGDKGGLITMIPVSITLGVLGVVFSYAAIRKILSEDLIV